MQSSEADLQTLTLKAFTVLNALRPMYPDALRPEWPGALVLNLGLGPQGAAVSLAANAAGAVCLSLEPDVGVLRAALRSGACDFIVNTLDEALRTLKNEVRRRLPLSVGVAGERSATLAEIVARGVQPELVAGVLAEDLAGVAELGERGSPLLGAATSTPAGCVDPAALLTHSLANRSWQMHSLVRASLADLKILDEQAHGLLGADDVLRRRWLNASPRLFSRERPLRRVLWLTQQEAAALAAVSGPTQ